MPASKAQQKAVSKYMKENYDEIKVRVRKGTKNTIQAHAAARSESVNGFINRAISETMERDGAEAPSEPAGAALGEGIALPSENSETAQRAAEGEREKEA
jgi:hypothetical protein|nr:hypothetical protein [uncultured Oscillibacter sp.]